MKLIPLTEVEIEPGRQRTSIDPGHIADLAESIRANGLFHAPILEGNVLVAGECRIKAIEHLNFLGETFRYDGQKIPLGMIPCTEMEDLTPAQRAEVELEENIRRSELSWQDRVAAIERIAKLKTEIALEERGVPPTGEELQAEIYAAPSGGPLAEDLMLARNLSDPAVAKAATKAEAVKAVRRKVQLESRARLAQAVGDTWQQGSHALFQADCLKWMAEQEPGQYAVIVTDPPYGMGADKFGDSGGMAAGAHGYEDSPEVVNSLLDELPQLLYRVAQPDAHLYLFCDIDWFPAWKAALGASGWTVFRTPLIWHKPNGMRAPWPQSGPWRRWESILFAVRGTRTVTRLAPDVLSYPTDDNLGHMAQKPVELYKELLSRSALPGEHVLDPFCGSGPIFPAAESLHLYATGVELDPASYGIALERMRSLYGE